MSLRRGKNYLRDGSPGALQGMLGAQGTKTRNAGGKKAVLVPGDTCSTQTGSGETTRPAR
jgi:hypothetical protein